MAFQAPVYGMDLELKKKQESAFDPQLEAQAKNWIQAVTGETITDLHQSLKDGVILCKLVNKIRPNTIRKINPPKSAFMMMVRLPRTAGAFALVLILCLSLKENIGSFLKSCQAFGINKVDQFMTVDLFEAKNMNQVIHCIHALARAAKNVPGFSGPYMETTPNVTPRVDTSTTQTSGHGDKDSGTMTSEQQLKGTEQKQIEEHKHEEKERREREEREREEKERREREERERREREEREREERERREREEREREERERREREEREREERERREREARERERREREERERREREEREREERERELHAKSPTKRGLQDLEQRIARLEELKVLIAKQIVEV
jgi:hypothetical protein